MSPSLRRVDADVFKHQADVFINQNNPASGIKYEWSSDGTQANKLGAKKNVRILSIAVRVLWTVQPTPLEVHVTIDGQTLVGAFANPVTATWYFLLLNPSTGLLGLSDTKEAPAFLLEGRSVKVEVEITDGTVQDLSCHVKWAKIP